MVEAEARLSPLPRPGAMSQLNQRKTKMTKETRLRCQNGVRKVSQESLASQTLDGIVKVGLTIKAD